VALNIKIYIYIYVHINLEAQQLATLIGIWDPTGPY